MTLTDVDPTDGWVVDPAPQKEKSYAETVPLNEGKTVSDYVMKNIINNSLDNSSAENYHTVNEEKDLPIVSEPNSSIDLLNEDGTPKRRKFFDGEGRAEKDIDYNYSNGDGTHKFLHEHQWRWKGNKPIRPK